MGLKLVTAAANYPVTLTEAKAHLAVEHSDHDTLISAFIASACDYVDGPNGFLGRALIASTWDHYQDAFPGRCEPAVIEIPLPPLISVTGVYYLASGVEQTLDPLLYVVDDASKPGRVKLLPDSQWPTADLAANAIRVRFDAGYQDMNSPPGDAVPPAIKAAILLIVGDLYKHREDAQIGATVESLPFTAERLLRPHRVYLSLA